MYGLKMKGGLVDPMNFDEISLTNIIKSLCDDSDRERALASKFRNFADQETDQIVKRYVELIYKALLLHLSNDAAAPWLPMVVMSDGNRSHAVSDYSQNDLDCLSQLASMELPSIIGARINDILWVVKKDYMCAERSVKCYIDLFNATFRQEQVESYKYIRRASVISNQLGKTNIVHVSVCTAVDGAIKALVETDSMFLLMDFIELQLANKNGDLNAYLASIDKIIHNSAVSNHKKPIEKAYSLKGTILSKLNRQSEVKENKLQLAQYYIDQAKKYENSDDPTILHRAIFLYEKSIPIYRDCKEKKKADDILRKLEPIKKKASAKMPLFSHTIDMTDSVNAIKKVLLGCTLQEALMKLCLNTPVQSVQELKTKVVEGERASPLSSLFPPALIDNDGKRIIAIPPIAPFDSEKDPKALEMHMHYRAGQEARIYGGLLACFLNFIRTDHQLSQPDLDFIFNNNAIIPSDRVGVIKFGVWQGLIGNYYIALHILVPQMEYIFREIAHECGSVITTFEDDKTEQVKTLSSVFELPELVESYDENILFTLKGLLNEKAGSNLRNKIAHGIMDSSEGNSSIAVYFICMCLKIFSWYSSDSLKILMKIISKEDS
jgi:hypothetical protein